MGRFGIPIRLQSLLTDLEPSICETLRSARAPSTRIVYGNCWAVFTSWCKDRGLDPVSCPLQDRLQYLQYLFDAGRVASKLKVYMAAISFNHGHLDGRPFVAPYWVAQFLHGARRLRPPRVKHAAARDLPLVQQT